MHARTKRHLNKREKQEGIGDGNEGEVRIKRRIDGERERR